MAYYSVEPFSPVEAVVTQILEGFSGKQKMPRGGKQNPEEMKKMFDSIFFGAKHGGDKPPPKKKRQR